MSLLPNVVVAPGDTNEVTIQTKSIKYNITKILPLIKPPQSSGNWSSGPKENKMIDLLRIEERYTVTGFVAYTEFSKIRSVLKRGGSFDISVRGETLTVNSDQCEMSDESTDSEIENTVEDYQTEITITFIVGGNI